VPVPQSRAHHANRRLTHRLSRALSLSRVRDRPCRWAHTKFEVFLYFSYSSIPHIPLFLIFFLDRHTQNLRYSSISHIPLFLILFLDRHTEDMKYSSISHIPLFLIFLSFSYSSSIGTQKIWSIPLFLIFLRGPVCLSIKSTGTQNISHLCSSWSSYSWEDMRNTNDSYSVCLWGGYGQ